jgi:hypothetical protein
VVVAALVALDLATAAPAAWGDADPASDILPLQDVFLPFQPPTSPAAETRLRTTITRAKRAGFQIKVALIAGATDLGGVPNFFNQPQAYSQFLGRELSFNKTQPLLVVMPAGFGVYGVDPRAPPAVQGLSVPAGAGPDELAASAVTAIGKMAAAVGHPFAVPKAPPATAGNGKKKKSGGSSAALIFIPGIILVLGLAAVALVGRVRRRGEAGVPPPPAG